MVRGTADSVFMLEGPFSSSRRRTCKNEKVRLCSGHTTHLKIATKPFKTALLCTLVKLKSHYLCEKVATHVSPLFCHLLELSNVFSKYMLLLPEEWISAFLNQNIETITSQQVLIYLRSLVDSHGHANKVFILHRGDTVHFTVTNTKGVRQSLELNAADDELV